MSSGTLPEYEYDTPPEERCCLCGTLLLIAAAAFSIWLISLLVKHADKIDSLF
jgi:hypothetical protein